MWHFCLKNDWNGLSFIKAVPHYFLFLFSISQKGDCVIYLTDTTRQFQRKGRGKSRVIKTHTQPADAETNRHTQCLEEASHQMTSETNQSPEAAVQSARSFHRLSERSSSPSQDRFKNHPSPKITVVATNASENRLLIITDDQCLHWGLTQNTSRVFSEVLMHDEWSGWAKMPKVTLTNFKLAEDQSSWQSLQCFSGFNSVFKLHRQRLTYVFIYSPFILHNCTAVTVLQRVLHAGKGKFNLKQSFL